MILFIIQPFPSHYYPTFGLANYLKNQGEKLVYTTSHPMNGIISEEGFIYHEFQYLSEYMIRSYRSFFGLLLKSILHKEFYQTRYQEFQNAYQATKILIEKYQPAHIYLDQSLADYYFFLKPHVKNITILHTKFYSGKVKGIPPMDSTYIPNSKWFSKILCEWKWFKLSSKQLWIALLFKIAFLGKDELYLWKKHCKEHKLDWQKHTDFKHALNRGIKGTENLVLAPKELEFSNFKTSENLKFYGELSEKNEARYFSKKYKQFKKSIANINEKLVIYLAFGTLYMGQKKVEDFFNQMISVVAELENVSLILSKGKAEVQLISSHNSVIFDFVPQQDVLSYADLFITHGGLGSIKEAYHAQVPMLVIPLNKKIDQPGNAARIKAAGFGDMLNIDSYSKKELINKLSGLLDKKFQTAKKEETKLEEQI